MDTDWLLEDNAPLEPNDPTQLQSEQEMLTELAKNIGLYDYNYTEEANNDPNLPGTDDKEHLGIVAQQLLAIPGLASAVNTTIDENGQETYTVDGNKVALASLGYIAALSKIVLEMRGIKYDDNSSDNASTIQTGETEEGNEASGTTGGETTITETSGNSEGSAVQTADNSEPDSSTATGLDSEVYSKVMDGVGK